MQKKTCGKCGIEKTLKNFYRNGAKYWQSYCKICTKQSVKTYHAKHPEKARLYDVKNREANRQLVQTLKAVPCADCGVRYPHYIMDFDHLPEFKKRKKISRMTFASYSLETIRAEAAKCDVVCANCHRERTWKRQHAL
jgi:hypothetical protein